MRKAKCRDAVKTLKSAFFSSEPPGVESKRVSKPGSHRVPVLVTKRRAV